MFRLAPIALCLAILTAAPAFAGDPMVDFAESDPVMNAAMAEARDHLPGFLEEAAKADLSAGNHMVKWAYPLGGNSYEHIWVHLASVGEDRVEGFLANAPNGFDADQGDAVTVPVTQISDWSYWSQDGRLYGSWTTRVMLPHLSAEDREYFEGILAPLPQ